RKLPPRRRAQSEGAGNRRGARGPGRRAFRAGGPDRRHAALSCAAGFARRRHRVPLRAGRALRTAAAATPGPGPAPGEEGSDMRKRSWLAALLAAWLVGIACAAGADERIILEKQSPYNAIVVSETDDGLRILRFERFGARQSVVKLGDPGHLELPYARVMIPAAFLFVERPQAVLVIGLGGGTIPSFLRQRFPEMTIDIVEIDPGVVAVAKSHFEFREDDRMRAHVADGRRFVEQATQRYDLIFLDGFGTDSV